MLKFSPTVGLTNRIPGWLAIPLNWATPSNTPPPRGAVQIVSPKGSSLLRTLTGTCPAAQPSVPAVSAVVESLRITLIPVVQLWIRSLSNSTVAHWRALGFAPTRVGMLAQSLGLVFDWSVG